MADKMVETQFSENPFSLPKQALGIFTREKADGLKETIF